ncbi:MAG: Rieske 2Fe-2S domain-containing protein [Thermomicrobiales bacterium]
MATLSIRTLSDTLTTAAAPWLDEAAERIHAVWDPLLGEDGPTPLKNALYGTWLGHPLHPAVTDVPLGLWSASALLDAAGMERGADITLKAGTLGAVAAAATGVAQWHDLQNDEGPRRLGTLHATLNGGATVLYGLSWVLRDNGSRRAGVLASIAGLGLAGLAASMGGDLSYRLGVGVSRVAFEESPDGWTTVATFADLGDGALTRVEPDEGEPLVLLRQGDAVLAASATCTHVGAPLDEGERDGTCVTCPWHGSVFDLTDGHVVNGPATSPLHAFETRIHDGDVQVRATNAF